MHASPFDYVRASSWSDAVSTLASGGEEARAIAGGQSLVPMMVLRLAQPTLLVDIGGAAERAIERDDGKLILSALTRHVDTEQSPVVRESCPMLAEAAGLIGNVRVRHRGTVGGSLAHGEPTAEWPCLAVAVGATVHAVGPSGERAIPASDLFVTHLTTSLEPGELITRIEVPVLGVREGSCFLELSRRAGDFAIVEVAAIVAIGPDERCSDVRLVVGATADRPLDVSASAAAIKGGTVNESLVTSTARSIAAEIEIGPSNHASPKYRREMAAVLIKRALMTAAARAVGNERSKNG